MVHELESIVITLIRESGPKLYMKKKKMHAVMISFYIVESFVQFQSSVFF